MFDDEQDARERAGQQARLAVLFVVVLVTGSYLLITSWLLVYRLDAGAWGPFWLLFVPVLFVVLVIAWMGRARRRGATWVESSARRAKRETDERYLEAIRTGRHLPWPEEGGAQQLAARLAGSRNTGYFLAAGTLGLSVMWMFGNRNHWPAALWLLVGLMHLRRAVTARRDGLHAIRYQRPPGFG